MAAITPLSGTSTTVKISELEVAAQANDADQLEANQSGTTRSITVGQIADRVVTDHLGTFAPINNPTLTGDPKSVTPATSDNDTSIATTAFVRSAISTYSPPPDLSGYAPLASPTFTGDPKAPTPATADNDTSIATTAFVKAQGYSTTTGTLTGITGGTGITVTGTAPSPTVGLTSTITAGGPTGSATAVPVITYNAQGQLTAVTTATISIPPGTTVSDTAPGSPTAGQLWWNSTLGTLYIFYNDGNSSQWVPATPATAAQSGTVVQVASFETGAVATGTTTIPQDDTIPQSTEGDQYMTLSITPKSATSTLVIDVTMVLSSSVAGNGMVALFQDSTANALAVTSSALDTASRMETVRLLHKMTSGTTSSTAFKVRAGNNNAGTTTFNGVAGSRFFGGVMASSIVITETL